MINHFALNYFANDIILKTKVSASLNR